MKSCCVILSLSFFGFCAVAQETDWQKSIQWTIYSIHGRNVWQLPVDSLSLFAHRNLDTDSMKLFLAHMTIISTQNVPVWMGGYVVSCRLGEMKRKLLISNYGGFFYDEQEKRFYQLPPEHQREWLDYLADAAAGVSFN